MENAGMRILVVDCTLRSRETCCLLLKECGYQVRALLSPLIASALPSLGISAATDSSCPHISPSRSPSQEPFLWPGSPWIEFLP